MQPKNISCVFYLKFFFIVDSGSLIRYFLCESSQVSEWVSKWKNLVVNSTCKNKIKKEKKVTQFEWKFSSRFIFLFLCLAQISVFPIFFSPPPHSPTFHLFFSALNCKVPKFEYKKNLLISSWILNLIGFRFYDFRWREMGMMIFVCFFSYFLCL